MGGSCPPGKLFFLGGGKCPNLGVVNVRILGVVNVLLANDSQSFCCILFLKSSIFFAAKGLSFGSAADLDLYELDQKFDLDFGCDVEPDTVGRSISS